MTCAPTERLQARHTRVRDALERLQLDALLTTRPAHVFYLTNLAASAAAAMVTRTHLYLLTDFRYSAAVTALLNSGERPPDTLVRPVESSYDEAIVELLSHTGPGCYGFEASHATVRQIERWRVALGQHLPGVTLQSTDGVIEGLRVIKDAFETQLLKEGAVRLSEVATNVLEHLPTEGRSEHDIAADIDWRIKRAGFDRTAFDTIVASGPRSALPHAHPTERTVEKGDLLLFDFGGVFHGYCVDLSRTIAIGQVTAEQKRLYRAVREAQQAAIRTVRPGVPCEAVDTAARETLGRAGLAEAFGHSTGHGLGLDVHEEPRVGRPRAGVEPTMMAPGMVFTVEPGAYVPGFGGVRLEDDVVVTAAGCEMLTDVPFDDRLM